MNTISEQMDRLKIAYGVKKDIELAKALGKDKNTVSCWRTRRAIPVSVMRMASLERGVSLEWLLDGNGEMNEIAETEVLCSVDAFVPQKKFQIPVTVGELAMMFRVPVETIEHDMASGKLSYALFGDEKRFFDANIADYIAKCEVEKTQMAANPS